PLATRGISNSLIAGLVSALVVMALSIVVGWVVMRSGRRFWAFLDILTFLPIAIPGVVVALGLIWLYLPSDLPIYGTLAIIVIAYVTKFISYGVRMAYAGYRQLHPELEEAAYTSGAGWGRMLGSIYLPLLVPTVGAGILYITMRAFRELPASLLLLSHGNEPYSVVAYEFWSAGEQGKTAAYGVVVILVMTAILLATWKITRRRFTR
ncbi:MAG: ABC transporter permease subunit, partial [Zavarzinia sp.]|nr:ABC transporter permease subunit [Zavarzinia sp.]